MWRLKGSPDYFYKRYIQIGRYRHIHNIDIDIDIDIEWIFDIDD